MSISRFSKYATCETLQNQPKQTPESPILVHFSIISGAVPDVVVPKTTEQSTNSRPLDLTAGEQGLVGSSVHVTDEGGELLGRGVIGWNRPSH